MPGQELQAALRATSECVDALHDVAHAAGEAARATHETDQALREVLETERAITAAATPVAKTTKVGAEIPVAPCTDLKPVADAMTVLVRLMRRLASATNNIEDSTSAADSALAPLRPLTFLSATERHDLRASLTDALSVTEQLVEKFPERLPDEVRAEAEAILKVYRAAEETVGAARDRLVEAKDAFALLDPLVAFAGAAATITDIFGPVARTMTDAASRFASFEKPLQDVIDKFGITLHVLKGRVEAEINKVLKKLGVKKNVFKLFETELNRLQGKVEHLVLKPVEDLEAQVRGRISHEVDHIAAVVARFQSLTTRIDEALAPLDDLMQRYIASAAKVGVHPA